MPAVVVLGDLVVDVVLAPDRALETGTDVPGPGDAAPGRLGREHGALARRGSVRGPRWSRRSVATPRAAPWSTAVRARRRHGPRGPRVAGRPDRTDRRARRRPAASARSSQDRGAADLLRPEDLRAGVVRGRRRAAPARLLAARPAARAGGTRAPSALAREPARARQRRPRLVGPLLAQGRRAARRSSRRSRRTSCSRRPREAEALLGAIRRRGPARPRPDRGHQARVARAPPSSPGTATSSLRFEVATQHVEAADTTGAGDAFDAGFLYRLVRRARRGPVTCRPSLQRAAARRPPGRRPASSRSPRAELCLSLRLEPRRRRPAGVRPQVAVEPVEHPGRAGRSGGRGGPATRTRGTPPGRGRTRRSGRGWRSAMKNCSLSAGGQRRSASAWSISSGVRTSATLRSGDWRQSCATPSGRERVAQERVPVVLGAGVGVAPSRRPGS